MRIRWFGRSVVAIDAADERARAGGRASEGAASAAAVLCNHWQAVIIGHHGDAEDGRGWTEGRAMRESTRESVLFVGCLTELAASNFGGLRVTWFGCGTRGMCSVPKRGDA